MSKALKIIYLLLPLIGLGLVITGNSVLGIIGYALISLFGATVLFVLISSMNNKNKGGKDDE